MPNQILIVDDNRQVLEHLRQVLTSCGYQVSFITRSDFLLKRLENESFDLLLLDINLPGMSGTESLKEIKSHPNHKDLPVIMITSEDERNTLEKCFELGANDYIHKPINEIELKSRIRSAIESKKYLDQKIEIENKKALESKMMMLSSQMSPHFIFNSLGSIQSFILNNEIDKAVDFISEFAGLMRQNLENSTIEYISIAEEVEFLKKYLLLEKIRFNYIFDYTIDVDIDNEHDTLIPPMLLQPFIENAVIHGLSKIKDRKGMLHIELSETEDKIVCLIVDNGIGRATTLKNKRTNHKSVAISNLEARLELLNLASDSNEYDFEIIDLYNGNKASGTKVVVSFPNDLH